MNWIQISHKLKSGVNNREYITVRKPTIYSNNSITNEAFRENYKPSSLSLITRYLIDNTAQSAEIEGGGCTENLQVYDRSLRRKTQQSQSEMTCQQCRHHVPIAGHRAKWQTHTFASQEQYHYELSDRSTQSYCFWQQKLRFNSAVVPSVTTPGSRITVVSWQQKHYRKCRIILKAQVLMEQTSTSSSLVELPSFVKCVCFSTQFASRELSQSFR